MMQMWAVFRNSDLTEGRGAHIRVGLFEREEDARTAALGIDVQGTNGTVRPVTVYKSFAEWFTAADDNERAVHRGRLLAEAQRLTALANSMEA